MRDKKDLSAMFKEAGILFAITLTAGILLGFVHELTREPIRAQQEKAVQEACRAVLPGEREIAFRELEDAAAALEGIPEAELAEKGVKIGTIYEAAAGDGSLRGYVVEAVSSRGYGGNIDLYVGVTADGIVSGVTILEMSETAGLGMEAPKALTPQFAGRKAERFSYTKTGSHTDSEVDAISGATVTTEAVVDAVNGALAVAENLLRGGGPDA